MQPMDIVLNKFENARRLENEKNRFRKLFLACLLDD